VSSVGGMMNGIRRLVAKTSGLRDGHVV